MNQVKGRDGMVSSNRNRRRPLSSGEVEGVVWQGARTVFLQKNPQGFGFTLRHFIVYPPESSLQGYKVEENGNSSRAGRSRSPLEPMDTIFVKSVREHGPAHQAGLCTGDRLVSVNGQSVLGKTYSQVIALIQNSEDVLELSIMPKDEDVFQLAYSHDAYLKGNEPYPEEAQNPPEPPPFWSPLNKPNVRTCEPSQNLQTLPDNWQCRPEETTFPVDNQPLAVSTPNSGWLGGPEDPGRAFAISGGHRGRCSATLSALDFHFANHNAAIASATLPPPRRSRLPVSSRAHTDALCHQALSDWYYSQAEAAERISPRHRSISQDRLLELGLALGPSPLSSERCRRDTLMHHHQAAAVSHDSLWLSGYGGVAKTGGRKCSEKLLAAYAEYEHNYERSVETLAQASALVTPRHNQKPQNIHSTKFNKKEGYDCTQGLQHQTTVTPPTTNSSTVLSSGGQSGQQLAETQTRRVQEEELVGYKSYSPSFSRKTSHLLRQAHSFKEPSYSGLHLNWSPGSRSTPTDSKVQTAPRPRSTPAVPAPEEEKTQPGEDRKATPITHNQEVVLRRKPLNQRPPVSALRQSHFSSHVDSPEPPGLTPSQEKLSPVSTESKRGTSSRLAQHAFDSLSSIPFIGSIKSRRSSYLLAITTERSKSCDEGLNNFREEGRVLTKIPKRVKSFFTDGSLETLRAQEEARSKRHSTSELGTITFSDVRKEGWLHYKQILTEKGKKVGGGMRPWKRVFSVLRSSLLFLYKDKREAVLHGAGAGPGQDENPPVSIRGCLIDIAYSETKRKHTLRLTTQDFCEYLLQAEDRDDMLAWIRTIRENSKTDNEEIGSSRQALINKKLNDYRKHSLTGNKPDTSPKLHRMVPPFLLAKTDNTSANRSTRADDIKALWGINIMKKAKKTGSPKAFGVRLEDCQPAVNHKFVPMIVEMCCGMVEDTGLEYTGIYRVPGNNAMVSNLQEHLNKGLDFSTAEERWQDLNVISSLLKSFFRKLPEPLFTDDKYNDFIDANRIEDAEDRLKTMKKLIQDLPDHYYHTLKFLLGHLKKVADHAEKNKMEARNLALVFGPTLVRTSEDNMTDMVTHMPDRYKIVETLILHSDWFFSDGELDKEPKAPEDKQDKQPAPNIDHLLSNIGRPGMPGETCDSTTSDSLKSKLSSSSKKDLTTRDLTPKSIINAVTRKRKKCLSAYLPVSSDDEDSEHEPVKASTCRAGGGGGEARGVEEVAQGGDDPLKETWIKKGNRVEGAGNRGEREKAEAQVEKEKEKETKSSEHESRQRTAGPRNRVLQRPHSFIYPHQQAHTTHQRHLPEFKPASHSRPDNLATGRPVVPFWIYPTRPPYLHHTASFQENQQPDWNQQVPVRYRKTRGGRTRAVSMNVDLELWRNNDRDRGWRTEKVEVIRVIEGGPGQHRSVGVPQGSIVVPMSCQQTHPHPAPHRTPPTSLGWVDQGSPGSSGVVMRRSGHDSRDKTRARRRHTVVI